MELARNLSELQQAEWIGTPVVLNAIFLCLGLIMVVAGKKSPKIVAALAAIAVGLWAGVIVESWQRYGTPLGFEISKSPLAPIVAAVVVACVAGVLVLTVWKMALAILTALILATVAVGILRFAKVQPETLFDSGVALLSQYNLVGIIVFVVALVALILLVNRFYEFMFLFAAIHLGTLLLVSGASYFLQLSQTSQDDATSVMENLANMISDAFKGECHAVDNCDCDEACRAGIATWIILSWLFMALHLIIPCWLERKKAEEKRSAATH